MEAVRRYLAMRKGLLCAALLILPVFLAGCGEEKEREPIELAGELLESGNYEEARKSYEELIAEGSNLAESWRGIGISQLMEGSYADACISFEKSLLNADDADPAFIRDTKFYLASSRVKHGEYEKALVLYEELLNGNYDAEVLFLRGSVYLSSGEPEKAAEDFGRIADNNPSSDLMIRIYEVYRSCGRKLEGTAYLEKIIKGAVSDESDSSRGSAYYYLEDYENAKNNLAMAVKESPEDVSSMMLLGRSYLALGETENARAVFTARLDKDAAKAAACDGLALCDMADGNYEGALEMIRQGLSCADEMTAAGLYYNEIIALEYLGQWNEAREKAAAYVRQYSADEDGAKEYAFLVTRG
ncbi:MAG: tetratricopeptide repeat protein [Lachnospiraceae bacterium]|nr:tetratricopeptide repeat protein [Lachnospiraceae bacterium]